MNAQPTPSRAGASFFKDAGTFGEGWRGGCPDCGVLPRGNTVEHNPTCPLYNGVDRAVEADRIWFEQHPGHTRYTRSATWAERVEMELTLGQPIRDEVVVSQLRPGLRTRYFQGMGGVAAARISPGSAEGR